MKSREKRVSLRHEDKEKRVNDVDAGFASLQHALKSSCQVSNPGKEINATGPEDQGPGDVARIVISQRNAGDADCDQRPEKGKASGLPVLQKDDGRQGKEKSRCVARKRIETFPTDADFVRTHAPKMKCGVQGGADVGWKVEL